MSPDKNPRVWHELARRMNADSFRGVSHAVTSAYSKYSGRVTTNESIERIEIAQRRSSMLNDFGGKEINEKAIEANQLWALMPGSDDIPPETLMALAAYLEVSTGGALTPDDIESVQLLPDCEYVMQILADKPIINRFWESKLAEHTNDANRKITFRDNRWVDDPVFIPNGVLRDFADTVQIESVFNSSIQVLDELTSYYQNISLPATSNDHADIYKKCMLAEGLLAPVCEVIGLDRLSDAIINVSARIRFTLGGRPDLVEKAERLREQMGSNKEIIAATEDLISASGNEVIASEEITAHESEYGVLSREYLVMDETGKDFRCIMRAKTVGSIIKKLYKLEKEGKQGIIQDAIALMYITDEDDPDAGVLDEYDTDRPIDPTAQMIRVFRTLVQKSLDPSSNIQLKPSASRYKLGMYGGINIRGTQDVIRSASKALAPLFESMPIMKDKELKDVISIDDPVKHKHDFQTAKITGYFQGLPFEIQTKTALMRKQERSGRANHRRYKTGSADDDQALPKIHQRRGALGSVGLLPTEATADRGNELIRTAIRAHARQLGQRAGILVSVS